MTFTDVNTPELHALCVQYKVRELYAFGSLVSGEMHAESDLDFLVRFENTPSGAGAFDRFMEFKESLEALYARRVDLLTLKPYRNRIFQAEVDQHKKLLYAA